jgi:hypothetical protein
MRKFPPSLKAIITSSSLYKQSIPRQNTPERGGWFLTLASPRYEFQASNLLKKFLEKIINLSFGVKIVRTKSCDCPP